MQGNSARTHVARRGARATCVSGNDSVVTHSTAAFAMLNAPRTQRHPNVAVVRDCPPKDQSDAAAECLRHSRRDQRAEGRAQRSCDASNRVEHEAEQEHGPASEPVGDGTVDQLTNRQADDIERSSKLRRRCSCMKFACHSGKRGCGGNPGLVSGFARLVSPTMAYGSSWHRREHSPTAISCLHRLPAHLGRS